MENEELKVIQVAIANATEISNEGIYILYNDGQVWVKSVCSDNWKQVKLPHDEDEE